MTTELIAMLGGGASGFFFKLIGTMVTAQQKNVTSLIKKQKAMDESADAAAKRTGDAGAVVRRIIVVTVLFGVIIAPFILAHSDEAVTVAKDYNWVWIFKGTSFETLHGYVILPEIRQTVLAIVGFYFGSSSVK